MQTCTSISEDLSAYLDGELPPQERASVEAHLNACAACKAEYESLVNAHAAMASLKKMKAPQSLREKVNAELAAQPPRINELSRHRRARLSWAMLATGLAATVLVALLGIHYFYTPASNLADNREIKDGTTLAKNSPSEAQESTKSTTSTESTPSAPADVASRRLRKRLEEKSIENRDAANESKLEELQKPGEAANANGANRALDKGVRMQAEESASAQPSPARRGGADKTGAGETEARRDAELAKATDAKQLDDQKVLEQRQFPVPHSGFKTEQQQTQNTPAAPKAPAALREKIAPDGAPKTEGLAGARAEPLAPTKPAEAAKTDALKPAEKDKDRAAKFGQALKDNKSKKEEAPAKDEPAAPFDAKKEALAEATRKLDAQPNPKQPAPEIKPATDPAKGAELDFAERAKKSSALPTVGQGLGAGGGNGAAPKPLGRADTVITLHTRDTEATLAKLKSLAEARQASLAPAPAQPVDAAADKPTATTTAAAKLAILAQTEYVLTVSADQAAALRQDLDALQEKETRDTERVAQKPANATVAAPPAKKIDNAEKADNAPVTLRVIIEADLKK
ncbi:MAG TPA: zf-HC2 domain-containing protein [Planctomycetota bacterium]|nr:zf-HC2 domain-containing protein [Planctomycetota bacterium]